jgi:hypothetical protein
VNLAVRVQHAPERADLLPALLDRLAGLDVQVVPDPGGSRVSSWRSHRACLEAPVADDVTHLLCIQDDAQPCSGFAARVSFEIKRNPERIIALFTPGFGNLLVLTRRARDAGRHVVELPVTAFVPIVAVVYPIEHARAIPEFADKRRIGPSRSDDAVIATYVRAHRLGALATVPSLVEHRTDVPSVMSNRHGATAPHRRACWFVD